MHHPMIESSLEKMSYQPNDDKRVCPPQTIRQCNEGVCVHTETITKQEISKQPLAGI